MIDPGRLFMFGVYGTKPSRETVALFRSTQASGLLLLARNIESPAQTRRFIDELEQKIGRPLLTAVDHEGGWVLRFSKGVSMFPGNAALGRAGKTAFARDVGKHMGRDLAPLGIRLNLAPVLDVATRDYNPGIGIRSFGSNFAQAGSLGAAFIRGLQSAGVSACAKHFPGKGAATVDAHIDLPTIKLSKAAFSNHLTPFRQAVEAGVDAIMTAHIRLPAFDTEPATFSRKIVGDVLRRQLGYAGLIISDDLCMGAITKRWPVAQATLKCLDAGHDMLMIAHDTQGMRDAVDLLREAAPDQEHLEHSVARIERLLPRRKADARPKPKEAEFLARRIATAAITIRPGRLKLPLPGGPDTLIIMPDFRPVVDRFTFENGPDGPEALVRQLSRGCQVARAPIDDGNANALTSKIDAARCIVFLCFEARRFAGQAAVLRLLGARAADKTAAILIRSSWDAQLCPKTMTLVDSAGYRLSSLAAALARVIKQP